MSRFLCVFITLLMLCACDNPTAPTPTRTVEPIDPPQPPEVLTPSRYFYGENSQQFGDLRMPASSSGKVPVVVLIHGGCWLSAYGKEYTEKLAKALPNVGYATWNIEYRRIGSGGEWPMMFQDVGAAIDYLQRLQESQSIDADRVIAIGHSAGGHLALWAGSRGNISTDSVLFSASYLKLRGVIALGSIVNLDNNTCREGLASVIDGNDLTGEQLNLRLAETSPIHMLPTGMETVFLSGDQDHIVHPSHPDTYVQQASIAGDVSQHFILSGLDHFELVDPDALDWDFFVWQIKSLLEETDAHPM